MLLRLLARSGTQTEASQGFQILRTASAGAECFLHLTTNHQGTACCSSNRSYNSSGFGDGNSGVMSGGDSGSGSRRGGRKDSSSAVAIARELRKQCEAYEKEALEQQAARMVMSDPMAQLMASRGMPLGISVKHTAAATSQTHTSFESPNVEGHAPANNTQLHFQVRNMEAIEQVFCKARNSSDRSGSASYSRHDHHDDVEKNVADVSIEVEQPGQQRLAMQELEPLSIGGLSAARGGSEHSGSGGAAHGEDVGGGAAGSSSSGEQGGSDGSGGEGDKGGWGYTTMASSAEIAQKIADSNAELARMAFEAEAAGGSPVKQGAEDEELQLGAEETKYKTLEQMSSDIKGLDEVFELLASVPWLDEDDVRQKELKGMAMVSLLGTLEDVGFNIRPYVERIWAGESDDGMVQSCTEAKDQAAVLSILFHTRKIVDEFGVPQPMPLPSRGSDSK